VRRGTGCNGVAPCCVKRFMLPFAGQGTSFSCRTNCAISVRDILYLNSSVIVELPNRATAHSTASKQLFHRLLVVPVVRPELSRKMVVPPLSVVAVPVVRPRESRKMVVLPDLVAVPTVLPELSRNVSMFWACVVPVARNSAAIPVRRAFFIAAMLRADARDARASISLGNAWPMRGSQRLVVVQHIHHRL